MIFYGMIQFPRKVSVSEQSKKKNSQKPKLALKVILSDCTKARKLRCLYGESNEAQSAQKAIRARQKAGKHKEEARKTAKTVWQTAPERGAKTHIQLPEINTGAAACEFLPSCGIRRRKDSDG